jgi:hypothetical protein
MATVSHVMLNMPQEWFEWAAQLEEGFEVAAGVEALRSARIATVQTAESGTDYTQKQSAESIRLRILVLMVAGAWPGKSVTRSALNAGLILMLSDDLRAALLSNADASRRSNVSLAGMDYLLQELQLAGFIELDNSRAQQVVLLARPYHEIVSAEDLQRLQEVKQIFENEKQLGRAVETEEFLDGSLELVSQ